MARRTEILHYPIPGWAALLVALIATGCSDPMTTTTRHELAHPGGWAPPPEILALADTYDIENVQAGPWIGQQGCSMEFQEGTRILQQWLYEHWPQITNIGGYSCRKIANSNSMSVHGTGRALDIHFPTDSSQPRDDSADNDLGDPVANWLLEHAEEIGVQGIIWDNMSWYSSRPAGERFRVYTNEHKHHDHIHMELNPEAAEQLGTPWFDGPMGPPDLGSCGEPIGANGGTVDDSDACFTAYGPAEFWRIEEGVGHEDSLHWTNAFESDEPSNWARWNLEFAEAGQYRLEYHNVAEWAVYDSAQYRVRHAGEEEDVFIDLSAVDDGDWQLIGEYEFAAGRDQWVSIYDNAPVDVPSDQHILADAVRLTRLDAATSEGGAVGGDGMHSGGSSARPDGSRPDHTGDSDDRLDDVEGRGGCGCATTRAVDPAPLFVLAMAFASRVRRRR